MEIRSINQNKLFCLTFNDNNLRENGQEMNKYFWREEKCQLKVEILVYSIVYTFCDMDREHEWPRQLNLHACLVPSGWKFLLVQSEQRIRPASWRRFNEKWEIHSLEYLEKRERTIGKEEEKLVFINLYTNKTLAVSNFHPPTSNGHVFKKKKNKISIEKNTLEGGWGKPRKWRKILVSMAKSRLLDWIMGKIIAKLFFSRAQETSSPLKNTFYRVVIFPNLRSRSIHRKKSFPITIDMPCSQIRVLNAIHFHAVYQKILSLYHFPFKNYDFSHPLE